MSYSKRINQIIKYYKLTQLIFANKMKIQRSSLSHIHSGRNKPSMEFVEKLHYSFPNINIDWFITGEGLMLKIQENLYQKKNINNSLNKNNQLLDMINILYKKNIINEKICIFSLKIIKIILLYSNNTFEIFCNNTK